jgi:Flp pilus assembly protein TadD
VLAQNERGALAKIGFALARGGRIPEAEKVFGGLAESAPEKDGAVAGLALCAVIKGEGEKAVEMLDRRLARGSVIAAELMLYKLLALGMTGQLAEAEAVRDEMDRNGMTAAVLTADALLADLQSKKQ